MKRFVYFSVIALMLASCGGKKDSTNNDAVGVETEIVSESSDANSTGYVGEIEAEKSTACSFNGSGTILSVQVEEGQHVSKGQLIATLDPTQAKNTLAASQAAMMQAQDGYNRLKTLHEQKSLSDMEWVEMQSKVAQTKAAVSMAKKAIRDCNLVAPCSGVVAEKSLEAGMTALPAEPVCRILDISTVKVKVSIPEKEIGAIKPNTASQVYVAALGRTYKGGTIEKGIQADALSRTYEIKINVNNADGALLPGMVANVSLDVNTGADVAVDKSNGAAVITVPVRCVQQNASGKNFVWVVRNNKSYRQNVTVGETVGNRIVVTTGLKSGEKVIVAGYQKVSEGHGVQE